jgi:hypothetical protein
MVISNAANAATTRNYENYQVKTGVSHNRNQQADPMEARPEHAHDRRRPLSNLPSGEKLIEAGSPERAYFSQGKASKKAVRKTPGLLSSAPSISDTLAPSQSPVGKELDGSRSTGWRRV